MTFAFFGSISPINDAATAGERLASRVTPDPGYTGRGNMAAPPAAVATASAHDSTPVEQFERTRWRLGYPSGSMCIGTPDDPRSNEASPRTAEVVVAW